MTTAGEMITAAFNKVGINTPTTAQIASALVSLNGILSIQGADFMAPVPTRESFALDINDSEYTIGSGGNFNTVRPLKLEHCFLRDADGYDHYLNVISPKDYNQRYEKGVTGRPENVYFVPEYPLAKIIFDYAPERAYDAHFEFWKNFTEFADTTTEMLLPNEYKNFFIYNLAVSCGEDWDRVVPKSVYLSALTSKDTIDRLNASTRPPPKSKFDVVTGRDVGGREILTDEYIDGGAF